MEQKSTTENLADIVTLGSKLVAEKLISTEGSRWTDDRLMNLKLSETPSWVFDPPEKWEDALAGESNDTQRQLASTYRDRTDAAVKLRLSKYPSSRLDPSDVSSSGKPILDIVSESVSEAEAVEQAALTAKYSDIQRTLQSVRGSTGTGQ